MGEIMRILFLTIAHMREIGTDNVYGNLLVEFSKNKHEVYVLAPIEKREKLEDFMISGDHIKIYNVNIGNYFSSNLVEKGIAMVTLESMYLKAIKKYFSDVIFDLVLYSTPPITFERAVKYIMKRDHAVSYLLLKDIFPQNAVDMGMMTKKGIKGMIYSYFRNKEKRLYKHSDIIGCMSEANIKYLLKHNPGVSSSKVENCPNSILPKEWEKVDKNIIRKRYGLPQDKTIFLYGGNLGKPQGPDFILSCLTENEKNGDGFILIIGKGSEYNKLSVWFSNNKPKKAKLFKFLPHEEYMKVVSSCDVGLIFLDHRFTIPNFPARLLTYMEGKMPVLAATDSCTDLGDIITNGGFGYWCESNDPKKFVELMKKFEDMGLCRAMGKKARKYLDENYTVSSTYDIIMKHFN